MQTITGSVNAYPDGLSEAWSAVVLARGRSRDSASAPRERRLQGRDRDPQPERPEAIGIDKVKRVLPHGEAIRRAVRWISEHEASSREAVAETSRRFDLSPLEEEFLIRHFLMQRGIGS